VSEFESVVLEFLKVAHVQSEQERVERLSRVFRFVRHDSVEKTEVEE